MIEKSETAANNDNQDLVVIGHQISKALFTGDLDACLQTLLLHASKSGHAFDLKTKEMIEQELSR